MSPPRTFHTLESLQARTVEEGDCWLWRGYIQNGTPQVMRYGEGKKGMYSVRRFLRELQTGRPQPSGHYGNVCGNPLCVAPDHILYKNVKNHMRDMALNRIHGPVDRLKKRQVRIDKGLTKLDMEKAQEIRVSSETSAELAQKYGVNQSLIKRIRAGRAWRVLSGPFAGLFK